MSVASILVVDDDERLLRLLKKFLSEQGYDVSLASNTRDARKLLEVIQFDLMVLDVMLPGESGIDFAKSITGISDMGILMLSAMGEPEQRIRGLETGVDDYLPKPFDPRELKLRIDNILRKLATESQPEVAEVRFGNKLYDFQRNELMEDGEIIHLTSSERMLLHELMIRRGKIVPRDVLARICSTGENTRAIDVQVTRLRRKIEKNPSSPRYLITHRNRGYTLETD